MPEYVKKYSFFIFVFIFVAFFFVVQGSLLNTQSNLVSKANDVKENAHNSTFILVLHGTANVLRGSQVVAVHKKERKEIVKGDVISTDPESIAMVDYGKGTYIRLAPGTKITFNDTAKTPTIYEYAGSVYVRFLHIIGVRDTFTTETDNAIAGVEGTKFLFWLDAEGNTNIYVNEHSVQVRVKDDSLEKNAPGSQMKVGQSRRGIVYKNDPTQVHDISGKPLESYDFALLTLHKSLDEVREYGTQAVQLTYSEQDWEQIDLLIARYFSKFTPQQDVLPTDIPTPTPIPATPVAPSSIPQTANPQPTPTLTTVPPSNTPVSQPTDVPSPTPDISGGNQFFQLFNKVTDFKLLLDTPTPTPTIFVL